MITVTLFQNQDKIYEGFTAMGHAGFSKTDEPDIICAAVTALTVTLIGTLQDIVNVSVDYETEDGRIWCRIKNADSISSQTRSELDLLFKSLKLGCQQILLSYGKKYLKVLEKPIKTWEVEK